MQAVIENAAMYTNNTTSSHRVNNLRKRIHKFCLIETYFFEGDEMHTYFYFTALVLLTDLENMLGPSCKMNDSLYEAFQIDRESTLVKQWCHFLVSLLHHSLTKLRLPSRFYWEEGNILEFVHLLDEMGTKCSRLQLIQHDTNFVDNPPDVKKKVFAVKQAFFRALPQLGHLQVVRLFFFICDDWALQQFGQHGANIV